LTISILHPFISASELPSGVASVPPVFLVARITAIRVVYRLVIIAILTALIGDVDIDPSKIS